MTKVGLLQHVFILQYPLPLDGTRASSDIRRVIAKWSVKAAAIFSIPVFFGRKVSLM
jgi:hypothetical protein